jgi:DNA-binding MarR family transcriptional regulator
VVRDCFSFENAAVPAMTIPLAPSTIHHRRLREIWRSAGWPAQDMVEVELLAAGWVERVRDAHGRETLRVTDAGVQVLAAALARNRAARGAHEALIGRVALAMQRAGRIAWRGLALRVRVGADAAGTGQWVIARPDLFSVRNTTVEDYLEPVVHEVKVRRADLLADLRRPAKGEAYRQMGRECWYVLAEGIGSAADVPEDYGVMEERGAVLEVLRPAPRRALRLPFATWMALARATPEPAEEPAQRALGDMGENPLGDDPAA